jgi:MFS family permease
MLKPIARNRTFYGWRVLSGLFVVGAIGPMSRFSVTSFFPYFSSEFGWSRSEIGLAQSLSLWTYSLLAILVGWMVDRVGSRKTILIGGLWCFVGWILLSTVTSLFQLYIYYGLLMAIATSCTHLVPIQGTSRKWFVRRSGLAGGVLGSAFAVGTAVFSPVLTSMSSQFGWRAASFVCALIFSIPIIMLSQFVIKDTPESIGQYPDGRIPYPDTQIVHNTVDRPWNLRDALRTPQIWLLFITYGLSGMVVNAITAHLVVWGVDLGTSTATAGLLVTFYNGPSIIARIGGGWLGDKYGKRRLMIIGASFSLIVMLLAWRMVRTQGQLMVFSPLLGVGTTLATGLFAPYLGDLFGRERVGSLFAVLTVGWGLIGGLGPIIWGIIFDTFGNYSIALLLSALCFFVALVALLLIRPVPNRI